MDDRTWNDIQALEDEELRTVRGERFTVKRYTPSIIHVILQSSGIPRPVRRARFDQVLHLGVPIHQLRPGMLEKSGIQTRSSSYIVAILRRLGHIGRR